MPNEFKILEGSYKGFPIRCRSSVTEGGRELAVKQFPNRDTQNVEDLGKVPGKFEEQLMIADIGGMEYFDYRNGLIRILNTPGPGVLIHPMYGRVENVRSGRYSLSENMSSFGDSTLTVTFYPSGNVGIPQEDGVTVDQVVSQGSVSLTQVSSSFQGSYSVTPAYSGNFNDSVSKIDDFSDQIEESSRYQGQESESFPLFKDELVKFGEKKNANALNGQSFSEDVLSLFDLANSLYESPDSRLSLFVSMFGFGDSDLSIDDNTIGRIERISNRKAVNDLVNTCSLIYAYQAVSGVSFDTVDEVETARKSLDGQFDIVMNGDSSEEAKDAIQTMRTLALAVLDDAQLNASQLVEVETKLTTSRLLAFSYYGDESRYEQISDINDIDEVSYVEGDVRVLIA